MHIAGPATIRFPHWNCCYHSKSSIYSLEVSKKYITRSSRLFETQSQRLCYPSVLLAARRPMGFVALYLKDWNSETPSSSVHSFRFLHHLLPHHPNLPLAGRKHRPDWPDSLHRRDQQPVGIYSWYTAQLLYEKGSAGENPLTSCHEDKSLQNWIRETINDDQFKAPGCCTHYIPFGKLT